MAASSHAEGTRVCLGRITGAHGVKGLVKVKPYGEDFSLLEKLPLYTGQDSGETISLSLRHAQGREVVAAAEGVMDRTAAQALRGTELWADRTALPALEPDTFYFDDLTGLRVRARSGAHIGTVIGVHDFGAAPLLEIAPEQGASFFLPFTKDYVPEIKPDAEIVIDLLDGVME